jgi:hypothetical protein
MVDAARPTSLRLPIPFAFATSRASRSSYPLRYEDRLSTHRSRRGRPITDVVSSTCAFDGSLFQWIEQDRAVRVAYGVAIRWFLAM